MHITITVAPAGGLLRGGQQPIGLWMLHHADLCAADGALEAVLEMAAGLVAAGVVARVGLCNVTVPLLERAAAAHARGAGPRVAAVQNEFSPWTRAAEAVRPAGAPKGSLKGTLPYCHQHGIVFMPYGFLGRATV